MKNWDLQLFAADGDLVQVELVGDNVMNLIGLMMGLNSKLDQLDKRLDQMDHSNDANSEVLACQILANTEAIMNK